MRYSDQMGTAVILTVAAIMLVAIVLVARRSHREKQPPADETPTTQFVASGRNFTTTAPRPPGTIRRSEIYPSGAWYPAPPVRPAARSSRRSSYTSGGVAGSYDSGSYGSSYDGGGSSFGGGGDCGGSSSGGGDGGGGGAC